MQAQIQSTNFAFLVEHDPLLEKLASAAEDSFFRDPNTTLIKLRQLGEALAQHMLACSVLNLMSKPPKPSCSINWIVR